MSTTPTEPPPAMAPDAPAAPDVAAAARPGRGAAARAVLWNGLQTWGVNLLGLVTFVVLGRLLAPADFGLVASATTVIWFLRVIVDAGFGRGLVQRKELGPADADTAFWSALGIGVAFTLGTIAAAPLLALLFGEPRLTGIVRALSVIFVFAALESTQVALLQRSMQWRVQMTRALVAAAASAIVAVVLALLGAGAWALVAQQLTLEGLGIVLLWRLTAWRPRRRFSRAALRELVTFGLRYSALRVIWSLGGNVDNFLIGVFLGPLALGYYVIAYRMYVVLNQALQGTINNVALPVFARLQDDREALHKAYYSAVGTAALVTFPAFAGLAAVAHAAVVALFGAKWASSVPVLQLLAVVGIAQAQIAVSSSYVIAVGRIDNEVRWAFGALLVQVVAFAIAAQFDIVAVAGSLAAVLLLVWPVRFFLLRRWSDLDLHQCVRSYPACVTAAGLMFCVCFGLGQLLMHAAPVVVLVTQIVAGAVTYALALVVLSRVQGRDFLGLVRELRA